MFFTACDVDLGRQVLEQSHGAVGSRRARGVDTRPSWVKRTNNEKTIEKTIETDSTCLFQTRINQVTWQVDGSCWWNSMEFDGSCFKMFQVISSCSVDFPSFQCPEAVFHLHDYMCKSFVSTFDYAHSSGLYALFIFIPLQSRSNVWISTNPLSTIYH